MSEKEGQVWKRRIRRGPAASEPVDVRPRDLSTDFEESNQGEGVEVTSRVSLVQQSDPGGTVKRPATSRPLFVNLRSGPKLVVPSRSKRGSRQALQRTQSFDEYERTPGFTPIGVTAESRGELNFRGGRRPFPWEIIEEGTSETPVADKFSESSGDHATPSSSATAEVPPSELNEEGNT